MWKYFYVLKIKLKMYHLCFITAKYFFYIQVLLKIADTINQMCRLKTKNTKPM